MRMRMRMRWESESIECNSQISMVGPFNDVFSMSNHQNSFIMKVLASVTLSVIIPLVAIPSSSGIIMRPATIKVATARIVPRIHPLRCEKLPRDGSDVNVAASDPSPEKQSIKARISFISRSILPLLIMRSLLSIYALSPSFLSLTSSGWVTIIFRMSLLSTASIAASTMPRQAAYTGGLLAAAGMFHTRFAPAECLKAMPHLAPEQFYSSTPLLSSLSSAVLPVLARMHPLAHQPVPVSFLAFAGNVILVAWSSVTLVSTIIHIVRCPLGQSDTMPPQELTSDQKVYNSVLGGEVFKPPQPEKRPELPNLLMLYAMLCALDVLCSRIRRPFDLGSLILWSSFSAALHGVGGEHRSLVRGLNKELKNHTMLWKAEKAAGIWTVWAILKSCV